MTQREVREILDDSARDRIPDDLNLLSRIAAQYAKQKGSTMKPQFKIALAVVLSLAVFAVLVFTVPPVASAMQHVLGYIPGLGLVEQGTPLRTLSKPVMIERESVRFIVEKASSDSQRTILLVNVDGTSTPSSCTDGSPQLRLPDGNVIPVKESAGHVYDNGYTQRLVFGPLPAKEEKVTLEIPCLLFDAPGEALKDWQIPLVFVDAGNVQVDPVIELPTEPISTAAAAQSQPQANTAQPETDAKPTVETKQTSQPDASPYGIALKLEKAVELEDGYILMGSMSWTDPALGDYAVNASNLALVDADNQPVSFEQTSPDSNPEPGSKHSNWAIKVPGKQHRWPLVLKSAADIILGLPDQPSFQLDLSSPPAKGESKDLNIAVEAGGHTIQVLGYTTDVDPMGNGMLRFTVQSDPSVVGIPMFDLANPALGGGGGGGSGSAEGPIEAGFTYNGALPTGKVQIGLSALMLYLEGDWKVTWQP